MDLSLIKITVADHIAVVTMDHPPVNALTVAGWFELADLLTAAGRDPEVGVVILSAAGKGSDARGRFAVQQARGGLRYTPGARGRCVISAHSDERFA